MTNEVGILQTLLGKFSIKHDLFETITALNGQPSYNNRMQKSNRFFIASI